MKQLNKIIFSFLLISIINYSNIFAETGAGYDLNHVMKISLLITLIFIAILMWFAIVYSEKNDFNGELLKSPFKKMLSWLTRSVPIEKEEDIMFHHDFDGIKELDNRIPPWFSFLFYGSIAFAIIYMIVFHVVGDGNVQQNEYAAEMQQASFEREMLIRSGAFINEETVTFANDAATVSEGKEIFAKNCVACHANDGGGGVGPNLTDDYWIHGGGIKNIFKTIKYGVPSKGMISWQSQLDPSKMRAVASYVITLHGTKPAAPKEPQGTIWKEEETNSKQ
ncbi:MAG: cbb3-type cytochrome c oxidase N-terminal domain-containing protein [Stygiobacter sp.]|jgi:cytochrome c oxidase cbb3-type subunit 3|uniref:Cbb3-type cytochrome c oxidase N-terminal domain-containing protein n=1 Tax=Stygiobacter electus TaxID=3032292 RepID=A0AAE3TEF9_9BACT|nr:cbb3-type cytochrome c oxidase N-terminal domain-containing protein [Stygiobacter electus]MDF1612243.1 cbb3-type cytochrome c oxidase N-terminal domain-containing protein [Stygiobacter electus]